MSGVGREDEAFQSPGTQHKATVAAVQAAGHVVYQPEGGVPFRDIDRTEHDFSRGQIQRLLELKSAAVIDGIAMGSGPRAGGAVCPNHPYPEVHG